MNVEADARQLTRAIVNLLTNAATYTGPGGATLGVSAEGQAANVRVRDTGPGIRRRTWATCSNGCTGPTPPADGRRATLAGRGSGSRSRGT